MKIVKGIAEEEIAFIGVVIGFIIGFNYQVKPCCPYTGHLHHAIKHNLYYANNKDVCKTDSLIYEINFKQFSSYTCE